MNAGTFSLLLTPAMMNTAITDYQFGTLQREHDSISTILCQEVRPEVPAAIQLSNVEELIPKKLIFNDVEIALLERPACVFRRGMTVFVQGWEVEAASHQVYDIPREMARRFLLLYGKAQDGVLSEAETECWGYIVDHVDYAGFCESRARPMPYEGVLKERSNNQLTLMWADGTINNVREPLASHFELINTGGKFRCFVKFRNNSISALEGVTPIETSSNDDWSWIERPA
jgi:hypothetical protein